MASKNLPLALMMCEWPIFVPTTRVRGWSPAGVLAQRTKVSAEIIEDLIEEGVITVGVPEPEHLNHDLREPFRDAVVRCDLVFI